ncbi:hypothetical protein Rs2_25216 [Raphanus sativus]|uniref:14.7 kDa heat shock protein-like n=1 Tax=Raphanus sativus TaxID=3726 RepID=A0A6J0NYR9_RAPSA|nr:14.7 kDa heat shock protein-like [Raphanus sativus]KAJ4898422.1 hypothetical protein Rs2_25216 [Raphanus sativus]
MGGAFSLLEKKLPRFAFPDSDWPENFPPIPNNRFQKSGNLAVYEVKETNAGCIMKVDVPGCSEAGLSWWVKDNNILFFADESPLGPFEGRRYGGTLVFDSDSYMVKRAHVWYEPGVMYINVPKIPGKESHEYHFEVSEQMLLLENSTSAAAKEFHGIE